MVLKTFGWSFAVTAAGLACAAIFWGWEAFVLVAILSILEISLSFDNAVVNMRRAEEDERLLAEDLPHDRHPHRRLRYASRLPGRDRRHHRQGRADRGRRPGHGRPRPLRAARHRRASVHRRVRWDVPADDLPGVPLRRAGTQVDPVHREAALEDRPDRRDLRLHLPHRAAHHRDDHRHQRNSAWRRTCGQIGDGHVHRHHRPHHVPHRRRLVRALRGQARRGGGAGTRGGGGGEALRPAAVRRRARGQGRVLHVPLPGGPGRLVLLRRRHRRLRHHEPHLLDGAGSGHRRDVRPVADGLPGPPGHPRRLRVPGARRALRDRRPGDHPADHHQVAHPRGHHRPDRRRLHRPVPLLLHPPQPAHRARGRRRRRRTGRKGASSRV